MIITEIRRCPPGTDRQELFYLNQSGNTNRKSSRASERRRGGQGGANQKGGHRNGPGQSRSGPEAGSTI
jgi:hypothetical protein